MIVLRLTVSLTTLFGVSDTLGALQEEEDYANFLCKEFYLGVSQIESGMTRRAYLSSKLTCTKMRISKKFKGKFDCSDVRVYPRELLTCHSPMKHRQEHRERYVPAQDDQARWASLFSGRTGALQTEAR